MASFRDYRRMIAISLAAFIIALIALGAGSLADSDEKEEAPAGGKEAAVPAPPLPDSVVIRINGEFRTIEPILRKSCSDCHSNATKYPWYHNLPIIGGMMDDHIKEGRENLDFTDGFPFRGGESQAELLEDMRKEIEEKDMPLLSYRLLHWGALIEGEDRDSVFAWIDRTLVELRRLQPASK